MKKKVSLKNAILQFQEDVDDPSVLRKMPSMIRWGIDADRKIGSYYDYKRTVDVVEVTECKAEIPIGVVHVLGIIIGEHDCDCDLFFDQNYRINTSTITLNEDTENTNIFYWSDANSLLTSNIYWEIQNNHIVFRSNLDEQKITLLVLKYEMDEDGLPLVNENNLDAIATYIRYKLTDAEKWHMMKKGAYIGNISSTVKEAANNASYAIKAARAESGEPTPAQKQVMAAMMNNPVSGYRPYLLNV